MPVAMKPKAGFFASIYINIYYVNVIIIIFILYISIYRTSLALDPHIIIIISFNKVYHVQSIAH